MTECRHLTGLKVITDLSASGESEPFDQTADPIKCYFATFRLECGACHEAMQFAGPHESEIDDIMGRKDWRWYHGWISNDGYRLTVPIAPASMMEKCEDHHGFHVRLKKQLS